MGDVDVMRAHLARSQAVLSILEKDGISLTTPRRINIFFWCPSAESAQGIARGMGARGYLDIVTSEPSNPSGDGRDSWWSAQGEIVERPSVVAAAEFTGAIVAFADEYGAEFDGWGTGYSEGEGAPA